MGRGGAGEPQERKGRGGERGASLGLCSELSPPGPRHLPRHNAVQSRHTLDGCPDSPVSAPRNPCDACVSLQPNSAPSPSDLAPPPRLPLPGSPEPAGLRVAYSLPSVWPPLVTGQGDTRGWLYVRSWVGPWLGVLSEGPWLRTGKNLRVS